MAGVHDQHAACPPEAPVVAVVGEAEIARLQRLLAGTEGCR
jgi:hypothetical protein